MLLQIVWFVWTFVWILGLKMDRGLQVALSNAAIIAEAKELLGVCCHMY